MKMQRPERRSVRSHLLVVVSVLAVVFVVGCRARPPKTESEAITLMAEYGKRGKYDDAIRVAQEWLNSHPEDASWGNGIFYDQIGIVYLLKASKDPARKDEWIKQAIASYDKNLSLHQPKDIGIELYSIGRGFEEAGNLSTMDSCLYYGRALKAFADLEPYIQDDTYTGSPGKVPLASFRRDNERARQRVQTKFAKAGCK
jgi:tetratricopeptide (TPR) repeat protein